MCIIPFKTCLPFSSHIKMINSPLWLHTGSFSHFYTDLRPKAGKYLFILVYISSFHISAVRRSWRLEDFLPSLLINLQKNNPIKLITTQPSVPSNYYRSLPFRKATFHLRSSLVTLNKTLLRCQPASLFSPLSHLVQTLVPIIEFECLACNNTAGQHDAAIAHSLWRRDKRERSTDTRFCI